ATNVSVATNLNWNSVNEALGYKLFIGTYSGGTDILNGLDLGNVLTYDLVSDLPELSAIFVTIIPYNMDSDAMGCTEEGFITEDLLYPPTCTTLTRPLSSSVDVPLGTDFTWNSASGATGYLISIGTYSEGTDILNAMDVGNVLTYDLYSDLPESKEIFVNITPYNWDGEAIGCFEESFVTETIHIMPPKFFTPNNDGSNDYWSVPNTFKMITSILIFDRYGKLIKDISKSDLGWDGTYLNKPLPASDYWYYVQYKDGAILNGHFSLVR
ncbi:MAG: T9SS type B sorting domain-containing protein, partial [Arenibacter algicola]|nr:T9SS type B sorting domain-containing protein [Arenibacter algicola]